jgi:hypothetical protein
MQVRGDDQGNALSSPPLRSNDSDLQKAFSEALAATGQITSPDDQTGVNNDAWAGALSLAPNQYCIAKTLNDSSAVKQPELEESQGEGEMFSAGAIVLPESSIRNKLEALLWGENGDDRLDTSDQINETVAAPSEGKDKLSLFGYDSKAGTVTLIVNGRRFSAQFWGEAPPQLSAADIAMPGQTWKDKSFAMGQVGDDVYAIAPLVPHVTQYGESVQVLWLGPGTPRSEADLQGSEYSDKYYNTRLASNGFVMEPRKLGENLRPTDNTIAGFGLLGLALPADVLRELAMQQIGGQLTIARNDFAYDPATRIVTTKLGDQLIEADFVGYSENPPTSAQQIQLEGQPWREGQSYILHEVSPHGRAFFTDYIVVPRDPNSTEVSAFMPATVHPFNATDPVRQDEIAVLKTIFSEKIVDLVRLRSGVFSSADVIAAQLSGELSDDEMEVLQRRHGTEFSQIYLTDNGRNGGGGTHFLIQGNGNSVETIVGPNVRAKQHTHPDFGGVLGASDADYRSLQLRSELTPQRSAKVIPQNQPTFTYKTVYAGPFEVNVSANTVELELNGELVTVPVLKAPGQRVPESAAEIQMPGDRWYGQPYQMYRDRSGNYFIGCWDYGNVESGILESAALPSPSDWISRDTLIVPLRDGQIVKARFSDEVVSAVLRGGDAPTLGNIRRPGAEDRGETYRLYQTRTTEWLIGFNT